MEEERRLAYVAMTRAERMLYISGAGGRGFDGSVRFPSRFVLDIDKGLLEFTEELSPQIASLAKGHAARGDMSFADNPDRLCAGQRVKHPVFGCGTVESAEKDSYTIRFDGMPTPRNISVTAKLERIYGE